MHRLNDAAAMAARAGSDPGHSIVVLDQVVGVIAGVRGVAAGAVGREACINGVFYLLSNSRVVTGRARSRRVIAWAVVQGNDLGRCCQRAVAVVALGAPQGDHVAVCLNVPY